ncbi:MAG TPA: phospholipase D-like domain-containing protein [Thermomicrobiales bacterium]|nr:phospholipase D-like domain-containing protein [Thermomicrobiales bacterium]
MNEPEDDLDETVYDATLNSNGVEVRHTGSLYIHAKGLIVDEQAVVVGSHNPTAQSLDRNREVSLVIEGAPAVKRGVDVFDRDWLQALPDQFRKGG